MPLQPGWEDIGLRLFLTLLAGTLIGVNRSEHGRPAGLRTILLVCLAASVSMIQVNLLLSLSGKASDSFVVMDLMRLPLGILSGMGFIGGGAILKKENLISGVTTAATLWFTTVIGLCFGGGQNGLGLAALVLALAVLWGFKWLEALLPQDRRAELRLRLGESGPGEDDIRSRVVEEGFQLLSLALDYDRIEKWREICCQVGWRSRPGDETPPRLIAELARHPDISKLEWHPEGIPRGVG